MCTPTRFGYPLARTPTLPPGRLYAMHRPYIAFRLALASAHRCVCHTPQSLSFSCPARLGAIRSRALYFHRIACDLPRTCYHHPLPLTCNGPCVAADPCKAQALACDKDTKCAALHKKLAAMMGPATGGKGGKGSGSGKKPKLPLLGGRRLMDVKTLLSMPGLPAAMKVVMAECTTNALCTKLLTCKAKGMGGAFCRLR